MPGDPLGAILQRDKLTYAVVPRTPVGLLTADDLEALAAVTRKYNVPVVKITSGQRFALVGVKPEDVDKIWTDLRMDPGKATELCLHYVQACPGTTVCRFGLQDSLGLGLDIEKMFHGRTLPAKVKIGVSGCPLCCGESYVRDIGVLGKRGGWSLIVGGSSARRPRVGDLLKDDLDHAQVLGLIDRFFVFYAKNAKPKERTAAFIDRVGIEQVQEAVLG